ncbi:MAG: DUF1559 domain-containing protein [Lacipirellulaceae bacterium]
MRRPLRLFLRRSYAAGFTLVELLVVIAIIGTLMGLLLPAVQSARESARGNTCRNNLKQLAAAITQYDGAQRKLPGLVNEVPNPASRNAAEIPTQGRRASWVVMLFPYIEQAPLWDIWSQNFDLPTPEALATLVPEIDSFQCTSDPPESPGTPASSYVANAGRALGDPTRVAPLLPRERAPNGAFFDLNKKNRSNPSGNGWPNVADTRENEAVIQSSIDYVQGGDGAGKTMMLSENIHAVWYTYPFSEPIETSAPSPENVPDALHHFGFVWQNQPQTGSGTQYTSGAETIQLEAADQQVNGARLRPTVEALGWMVEGLAFPSSNHPQSVNIAYFDGRVSSAAGDIQPRVYAQLMTTKNKRSDFVFNSKRDRELSQPNDPSDQL